MLLGGLPGCPRSRGREQAQALEGAFFASHQVFDIGILANAARLNIMLAAYCHDERISAELKRAAGETRIRLTSDWAEFRRRIPRARVQLVYLSEPLMHTHGRDLPTLARQYPLRPLILVVDRNPDTLRQLVLLNVSIGDVVWTDRICADLGNAIARAKRSGVLGAIASLIEDANIRPRSLRHALAAAIRSAPPLRRVSDLAKLAHCDRTALWRQWRRTVGRRSRLSPTDFIGWVLLIQALSFRHDRDSWADVAGDLGIHEHTLARLAKRHCGLTLRQCNDRYDTLASRFHGEVLYPMLGIRAHFTSRANELFEGRNSLLGEKPGAATSQRPAVDPERCG